MSSSVGKEKKHIKARNLNLIMIIMSFIAFSGIVTFSILSGTKLFKFNTSLSRYTVFKKSSEKIRDTSNYLTEQARLFIVTGDRQYAENYFYEKNINCARNTALQNLLKVFDYSEIEFKKLSMAFTQSENLSDIEMHAMKLRYMAEESISVDSIPLEIQQIKLKDNEENLSVEEYKAHAIDMIFDKSFLTYKAQINENCKYLIDSIESSSENELKENFDNLTGKITLLCISQILIFIVIVVVFTLNINVIINPINSYMKAIKENTRLTEKGSYELRCLARIYNNYFDHKAATERRLKKNAETDSLTGIMNRHAFEQICSTFKDPQNLIFLIVDVDDFKHINDTYGHTSGDKILKIISKKLVDAFRTTDYVARIGGDEFAVLITAFHGNANFTIRNKIKRLNRELSSIEDFGRISISVGASVSTNGFSKDMVKKADIALYKTKNEGKCGFNLYDKNSPSYVKV